MRIYKADPNLIRGQGLVDLIYSCVHSIAPLILIPERGQNTFADWGCLYFSQNLFSYKFISLFLLPACGSHSEKLY